MAAWYWFVIAGVAVVVIGGTIFLLTRGGDEEEAAAMEKAEMRSLEELAKDGIQLAVDGSEMFMAPEDPESGYEWLMHSTCEDIAEIESAFKAPGDEKDAEEKDGDDEDEDEDKKDSAKSLQKEDEDAEEDEEAEDEDAEKKPDTGARHFTVTGVAEGECELKLAHADKEKFDWEDEDTWEEAKEIVKIAITVGEAGEGDDEEKKGDDKEEEKEEEE